MQKALLNPDWISLNQACDLLGVSHPTFNKRRVEFRLKEKQWAGRLWFSKQQIERILLKSEPNISSNVKLVEGSKARVSQIKRKGQKFDLRSIYSIDAFGTLCLLCAMISEAKEPNVIAGNSPVVRFLASVGFFSELFSGRGSKSSPVRLPVISHWMDPSVVQQIVAVKFKGGERSAVMEAQKSLSIQGFSAEFGNYVGWVVGEL